MRSAGVPVHTLITQSRGDGGSQTSTPEQSPREHSGPKKRDTEFIYWTPQHVTQTHSLLSSESAHLDFRGFYHLGALVLVVTNIRLILENILYGRVIWRVFISLLPRKYGVLVEFKIIDALHKEFESLDVRDWPVSLCFLGLAVGCYTTLLVEKVAARGRLAEQVTNVLQSLHILAFLLVPIAVIEYRKVAPASGFFLLFCAVVLFMKMISYVLVNRDFRVAKRRGVKLIDPIHPTFLPNPQEYPANLRLGDLAYFICAPTLIYQLNYPRSPVVRRLWVLGKVAQLVVILTLIKILVDQYVIPTVKNAKVPLENLDWLTLVERVLKLAIPNLYIWLLMFYSFFHLWLNILAELLRFGDRTFYKDWWNAHSLEQYWRSWNLPVHNWAYRYVYGPMINIGLPKFSAANVVFFFSAVFHELLLSIPTHKLRSWAFLGMMGQVPLILMTRGIKIGWLGNLIFWSSFCIVGQPLCILLYYHGYQQVVA